MKEHLQELGPYRGCQPFSDELLVLTESFYLEDRTEEINPEEWYRNGVTMLNDYERTYLRYSAIMANKQTDRRWKNRGCSIYWTLEAALKDAGYPSIHNMLDHCTLANCFLRPAVNGQSLTIHKLDIEYGKDYVAELIQKFKPKTTICASSKAYNCVVKQLKLPCVVVNTCHPTSAWWNRAEGVHGRQKFVSAARTHLSTRTDRQSW